MLIYNVNSKTCKVVTLRILRVFRELRGKKMVFSQIRLLHSPYRQFAEYYTKYWNSKKIDNQSN